MEFWLGGGGDLGYLELQKPKKKMAVVRPMDYYSGEPWKSNSHTLHTTYIHTCIHTYIHTSTFPGKLEITKLQKTKLRCLARFPFARMAFPSAWADINIEARRLLLNCSCPCGTATNYGCPRAAATTTTKLKLPKRSRKDDCQNCGRLSRASTN